MGATVAAGVVFVLLPADIGFDRPAQFSGSAAFDHLVFHYNSAPSLHVIFAGLIVLALCEVATPLACTVYRVWLALIAVATVLTHQHHIIDVLSAAVFIAGARWLLPIRAASAPAPIDPSAMEETGVKHIR